MKAFRGYFDQATARITMTITDESTGIKDVVPNCSRTGEYYNLQGQRVEHTGRGLYIRDGKKFVAK